jgi:hypothetical protein
MEYHWHPLVVQVKVLAKPHDYFPSRRHGLALQLLIADDDRSREVLLPDEPPFSQRPTQISRRPEPIRGELVFHDQLLELTGQRTPANRKEDGQEN